VKIKVAEDLPSLIINLLNDRGYPAMGCVQNMGRWKDPALWDAVQAEQQFFITADKGFADTRRYPPGQHAGVLLLRPDEDGIRPMLELLERVLNNYDLNTLAGAVTVVNSQSIRVRRGK
jgi:predicted nuclease of predicted toxin-antitoxin system